MVLAKIQWGRCSQYNSGEIDNKMEQIKYGK